MCQITIEDKEIYYSVSNIKLQKSNGKVAKSFSNAYKDFIKIYLEVNVSDSNFVPPNVFQPYIECLVDGEIVKADTFIDRYTAIDETTSSCLIKLGTAGEDFADGDHELIIRVYDTPSERKPDFAEKFIFTVEP